MDPMSPLPRTAEEGDYFGVLRVVTPIRSPPRKRGSRAVTHGVHIAALDSRLRGNERRMNNATRLTHASALCLFDDCSAREVAPATMLGPSPARRPTSAMALDAVCANSCAACCTFSPNALVWSVSICACRARNSLWHFAISCGSFARASFWPKLHRVLERLFRQRGGLLAHGAGLGLEILRHLAADPEQGVRTPACFG